MIHFEQLVAVKRHAHDIQHFFQISHANGVTAQGVGNVGIDIVVVAAEPIKGGAIGGKVLVESFGFFEQHGRFV